MILQETQTVRIAEADWTDDGVVELLTFPTSGEHRTHMSPETARALARQLDQAAADAERAAGETNAQRAQRAVQHGFDIDSSNLPDAENGFVRVKGVLDGEAWWGVLDTARSVVVPFSDPIDDAVLTEIAGGVHGYVEHHSSELAWEVDQ